MGSVQAVHHLEVDPEIEVPLLATGYNAVLLTANREILGFSETVEGSVNQGVAAELPVAEVQVAAGDKLESLGFGRVGADVSDGDVAGVHPASTAHLFLGPPVHNLHHQLVSVIEAVQNGVVVS